MSLEDLKNLETETKALADDVAPPAPGAPAVDAPEETAQGVNYTQHAEAMVDLFVGVLTGYAPETSAIWSHDTKARVAAALAPVMEKYNFNVSNLPPEITLLIMAAPPLYQSAKIVAEQMRQDRLPKKTAENPASPAEVKPEDQHNPGVHPQMALYPGA